MRVPTLAAFALLVAVNGAAAADAAHEDGWVLVAGPGYEAGLGIVADMATRQAVFLKGSAAAGRGRYVMGTLERRLPLDAWRGHRLRLSLRLRNEGVASTTMTLQINRKNGAAIRSPVTRRWSTDDAETWRERQFVLDVPDDASELVLDVSLKDQGMVWVDELKLQAVGDDVPLSASHALSGARSDLAGIDFGAGSQPSTLAPDPQAYAPLVNGSFTVGGSPAATPGASPRN